MILLMHSFVLFPFIFKEKKTAWMDVFLLPNHFLSFCIFCVSRSHGDQGFLSVCMILLQDPQWPLSKNKK